MNPPKMPLHIGDYKRDTGHLRAAGHGAYLLLLMHYWSTGGLPDDDEQLASIACMTRAEWRKARPVISKFFTDGWKKGRVDHDLEKARKISEGASEAGKASGRSRSVGNPLNDRSSDVEPTLEPLNHSKKEEDPANAGSSSARYAFESGVIRLSQKDFDRWKKAFSHLDVPAELIGMTEWASKQPSWFNAASGLLAKRNAAAHERIEQTKNLPNGREKPVPDNQLWDRGL